MRIAFATLGCKINQYETDLMRRDFASTGNDIVAFEGEADVYVINTCSVTAKSDYQCRQAIRSATRRAKGAKVIVTGCYASTRPEEITKIPGVDLVLPNQEKPKIAARLVTTNLLSVQTSPSKGNVLSRALRGRTRGFLKIQDGCNSRCSYCIVPLARGKSRSVPQERVTREFEGLVKSGCPEIVLTGIHIGTYGADLGSGTDLTSLLNTLLPKRRGSRIRLSSIEPGEVTPEMVSLMGGEGLCRHLHIPLQSGDDVVLSAMKRNYTSEFYRKLLEDVAQRVPGIALGADIMVGFPGEGEAEFQNTLRLVENAPLTHLHVFSFSPRPGTPAAEMKNQVPEQVKKQRSETLREIGREKNLEFRKKFLDAELMVVVEDKVDRATGCLTGLTDNYIRVGISGEKRGNIGKVVTVRLTDVKERDTLATII